MSLLTTHDRCLALGVGGVGNFALVAQLARLGPHCLFGGTVVAVIELAVLDVGRPVDVIFGENLLVFDRLNDVVVVILVDFLVDGCVDLLVLSRLDGFVGDGWGSLFVDRSVVVSGVGQEFVHCCLGLLHYESRWDFS